MAVSGGTLLGLVTRSIPTRIRHGPITRCLDAAVDGQPQSRARTVQTKIVLGGIELLEA
jgi:hypothetical protein